jgi:hypothetical protein
MIKQKPEVRSQKPEEGSQNGRRKKKEGVSVM